MKHSGRRRNARTAASPPASSNEIAPKPSCCLRASAWPGCDAARVMQARDGAVLAQEFGERRRILLVHAQARIERAQAAQRQEAVERRAGEAERVRPPRQRARAAPRRAAITAPPTTSLWPLMYLVVECTTMSAPKRDRLLQRRRQEGVVDHGQRAGRCARPRSTKRRSVMRSSGLDGVSIQTSAGCRCSASASARGIGEVDGDQVEGALVGQRIEQPPAAAVAIVRHDQAVAGFQQAHAAPA